MPSSGHGTPDVHSGTVGNPMWPVGKMQATKQNHLDLAPQFMIISTSSSCEFFLSVRLELSLSRVIYWSQ